MTQVEKRRRRASDAGRQATQEGKYGRRQATVAGEQLAEHGKDDRAQRGDEEKICEEGRQDEAGEGVQDVPEMEGVG